MSDATTAFSGTNLARAGDHNQRVTLHAIRVAGPITRAELVATTGLTAPAIANITNRLLRTRLVLEVDSVRGGRGQPAKRFTINPTSCFSVGLNVDRDHITLVIVDFMGVVCGRASREVRFATPQMVRTFYQRTIRQLLAKAGIVREQLVGVGVAFPDDIWRTLLPGQPAHYAAWGAVKIDALLRDVLNVPMFVENDAAAAAIGEMQFGSGHRYRSFFYVLVTAALGGGLVVDGNYYRGATGRSAEIGWLRASGTVDDAQQLQHVVSLSALYRRLAANGHVVASPRGLMRLQPAAQRVVEEWIDACTDAMTGALLAINCLVNPEAILIGGRLPAPLVDALAKSLTARMCLYADQIPALAPIGRAETADDAPAVGAAILPFIEQLLPSRFALLKTANGVPRRRRNVQSNSGSPTRARGGVAAPGSASRGAAARVE